MLYFDDSNSVEFVTASLFDSCWMSCGTALSTQTTLALDGPFFDLWVVFVDLLTVLLFVEVFDLTRTKSYGLTEPQ